MDRGLMRLAHKDKEAVLEKFGICVEKVWRKLINPFAGFSTVFFLCPVWKWQIKRSQETVPLNTSRKSPLPELYCGLRLKRGISEMKAIYKTRSWLAHIKPYDSNLILHVGIIDH
jgi:hypothetical protein